MFADRHDAGKRLARELEPYKGQSAAVLALPRGGVVVASEIARSLEAPLDIVVVRKIGFPGDPEYAIGAIDESGAKILNEMETDAVDKRWLAKECLAQRKEAARRNALYREGRVPLPLSGKTAIVVDDGIATGLSLRLALRIVKAQKPKKVVVAVPVAPPGAERYLRAEGADEVVILEPPESFIGAIGAHYESFEQVEDEEVIRLLRENYGTRDSGTHR